MLNSNYLRAKYRKERLLVGIEYPEESRKKYPVWQSAIFLVLVVGLTLIASCQPVHAGMIDMHKIMMIESGGRNVASDIKSEHAVGLFQITPVVLKEFNQFNKTSYTSKDLFDTALNTKVAGWYLNVRIPQMLRAYKKPVTVRNILIAYNAGVSYVVKNKTLPAITLRYLRKYGVA
jgi:hypothetical protein